MGKDCKCKNVDEQKSEKKHRHRKCCVSSEKSVDCCNPAYQRLASIRTSMLLNSVNALDNKYDVINYHFVDVKSRTGQNILIPTTGNTGSDAGAYWVNGLANNKSESFSVNISSKEVPKPGYENAYLGYLLANKIKYAKWEECPQRDQVYGWYVKTTNEDCTSNLQLFQPYNNVPVNATLINLWDGESCYKGELLNLLELSNKALREIVGAPKTEGNIVVVKDKKHKWLLLVIEAGTNVDVCEDETEYVIFGVMIC